ncbi:hypothetical protein BDZ89DRAFT_1145961 [Hymenopellis radicata]|nr:hypothetical protein BDZ89DRAFT_1145961 [Hymenopellis radicata]
MGRRKLYATEEEKREAAKLNKREYYRRNAEFFRERSRDAYATRRRVELLQEDVQCDAPINELSTAEQEARLIQDMKDSYYDFMNAIEHDPRAYAWKVAQHADTLPQAESEKYVLQMVDQLDVHLDKMSKILCRVGNLCGYETEPYYTVFEPLSKAGFATRGYLDGILDLVMEGQLGTAIARDTLPCTSFP